MKILVYIQTQFQKLDPLFLAILGVVTVPFALLGIAQGARRDRRPSRVAREKQVVASPPLRVKRNRVRRRRTRVPRVPSENRL